MVIATYDEGYMHSFRWRLTPSSVIAFVSLSASITSAIDEQLVFQCQKRREAFSPASLRMWIQSTLVLIPPSASRQAEGFMKATCSGSPQAKSQAREVLPAFVTAIAGEAGSDPCTYVQPCRPPQTKPDPLTLVSDKLRARGMTSGSRPPWDQVRRGCQSLAPRRES